MRNDECGLRNSAFIIPHSSFRIRYLSRPPRAGPNPRRRGLRGRKGDPRSARDAGVAGDVGGAGGRLWHRRIPGLLLPPQRPAGGRTRGHPRGGRGDRPGQDRTGPARRSADLCAGAGGARAAGRGSEHRHRAGPGRGKRPGRARQGHYPVSTGAHRRADRRAQPTCEPCIVGEQRTCWCADCVALAEMR